jgi:nucleoid DNA-binding protein
MQIVTYLSHYLMQHQKLVLPGFGIFSVVKQGGYLQAETNVIYPPTIKIEFCCTETLNNDLANYIATQTGLEATQAQNAITQLIHTITKELDNGKTFLLHRIGVIALNNCKIELITPFNELYNQVYFGLKPIKITANISFPTIENDVNYTPLQATPITPEAPLAVTYSLANQAMQTAIISDTKPKPTGIPLFWWAAMVLVILTIAAVGATFYCYPPFVNQAPTHTLKSLRKPIKKIKQVFVSPQVIDTSMCFELVIAENLTSKQAEKKIFEFKNKGIQAHLINDSATATIQISAAKFFNLDSAQAHLKQLQQKKYPKAYLKTIATKN